MEAIYSSKFFKASKRKDKIRAALNDPLNVELVKQLKTYLDEEYQTPEYLEKSKDVDIDVDVDVDKDSDFSERSGDSEGRSSSGGGFSSPNTSSFGSPSSFDTDFDSGDFESESFDEGSSEDFDSSDTRDTPGLTVDSEDVEESTKLKRSTKITSSYSLNNDELSILQGTLNSRDDTKGVSRINIDNDELWIYYGDSINLDNVMDSIILCITSMYKNLKFNRLARSNNAIVFQIVQMSLLQRDEK